MCWSKRAGMAAAVFVLASLCVAVHAEGDKTVTITDKDKDAKVELAKGDKLLVKLGANPTTGFTWVIASKEDDKLKSAGKPEYEPANKDKKVVGGGGTQTFT